MDTTRRLFLRGAASLLGVAVVSPALPVPLPEDDAARFLRMAREGRVFNQTFRVTRPIVLKARGVYIYGCQFIHDFDGDEPTLEIQKDSDITIDNCWFMNGSIAHPAFSSLGRY
jgi:hypothetical protein